MRFTLLPLIFALFAVYAMAAAPLKRVIVSYPNEAPQSIVDKAIEAVEKAGGKLIHKYNIIKGFAADAPATFLESVHTLTTEFPVEVEEDSIVTTQNEGTAV